MKTMNVLLVSILLLSCVSLFAQTEYVTGYEVQYDVTYSIDSLNLERTKQETVYLYTGSEYGVFLNYNISNAEEIQEELKRQAQSNRMDLTGIIKSTDFPKQFYKNRQENQVQVAAKIADAYYTYEENAMPLSWDISDETKEFLDYQVQKATTIFGGRKYEAWFALEIPIADGPYIFYGLPGLIVELYDTEKHYHFSLRSIEKLDEPKTWELPKAKLLTKAEYQETVVKQSEIHSLQGLLSQTHLGGNARVKVMNDDGTEMSDADFRRMRKKSASSKNNLIELK